MTCHARSYHFMGIHGLARTVMGSWAHGIVMRGFMTPIVMACYYDMLWHYHEQGLAMGLPLPHYGAPMGIPRPAVSREWHCGLSLECMGVDLDSAMNGSTATGRMAVPGQCAAACHGMNHGTAMVLSWDFVAPPWRRRGSATTGGSAMACHGGAMAPP